MALTSGTKGNAEHTLLRLSKFTRKDNWLFNIIKNETTNKLRTASRTRGRRFNFLHYPLPPREQLYNRYWSNNHTQTPATFGEDAKKPVPLGTSTQHPRGCCFLSLRTDQGKQAHPVLKYRDPHGSHPSSPPPSFTQSPSPPHSLVRDGQTSPHRPRVVVCCSTCPPLSPSPPMRTAL